MATVTEPAAVRRIGWRWVARAAAGLLLLAILAEALRVVAGGNLHTLIPGEIYRSAQPSPRDLEQHAKKGVRTIVNLRGRGDGMDWYEDEAKACQALGLAHENLTFSAMRLPGKYELRRLVEVLDRAERPLLLHCRQGADRTGLASAVALLLRPNIPYAEARSKMGLRWGHWHWGPAGNLSQFFKQYEAWLADQKIEHSAAAFRRWTMEGYQGDVCQYEAVAVQPLQEVARADEAFGYRVTFRNTSPKPWPFHALSRAGIHLGCQIVSEHKALVYQGRGGLFEKTVAPGQEIDLVAALPPLPAGRYRVRIDLIEEGQAWFHQLGQEPIERELVVVGVDRP
jgi:protein tyrosine phosphatase (PTP) superfamily phosphohydrolase (DUF442 family)